MQLCRCFHSVKFTEIDSVTILAVVLLFESRLDMTETNISGVILVFMINVMARFWLSAKDWPVLIKISYVCAWRAMRTINAVLNSVLALI